MIIGHEAQIARLEKELPAFTLLKGPAGVGKHTAVLHLLSYWNVSPADVLWSTSISGVNTPLTVASAEAAKEFFSTTPFGDKKIFCAPLDGAHSNAVNAMLKLLEEAPAHCHVILWASGTVLPTIESRAHVEQFGMLTEKEILRGCTAVLGLSNEEARTLSSKAMGTLASVSEMRNMTQSRSVVVNLLKATAEGDFDLFDTAVVGITEDSARALVRWAMEARTGRWRVFSEQESFGLDKNTIALTNILSLFSAGASWRTGVRAALGPICLNRNMMRV